jgi:ATP adenylyltransferase
MTLEHMHLIPRRKDAHVLTEAGETWNVNALGFAGMLLVRSEKELETLQNESIGKILRSVGLESVHDIQVAGISAEGDP